MKSILFTIYFTIIGNLAVGQSGISINQYFQSLPTFSPSFTGANHYLDINVGHRQQWAGFSGSPNVSFLSVYSPVGLDARKKEKSSLMMREIKGEFPQDKSFKKGKPAFGLGGHVSVFDMGAIRETEVAISGASHVIVSSGSYLSLGILATFNRSNLDIDDLRVLDDLNDVTYQNIINNGPDNSYFQLGASLGFRNEKYYVSYSAFELSRTLIRGREAEGITSTVRHHVIAGYRLKPSLDWELLPNAFFRSGGRQPEVIELGFRSRYQKRFLMGLSYRSDRSVIGTVGYLHENRFNFSYSYDYTVSDFQNFSNSSHEFVVGIRLFNESSGIFW